MNILNQVFTTQHKLFLGIIIKEFKRFDKKPDKDLLQLVIGRAYFEASRNNKIIGALESQNQQAIVRIAVGIVKQLAYSYIVDKWGYDFREVSKSSVSASVNSGLEEFPQDAYRYLDHIKEETQQIITDGSSEAQNLDEMVSLFQKVGLTDKEIDIVLRTVVHGDKAKGIYTEYGFNSPNALSQCKCRILTKLSKALKIKGTDI